MPTDQIRNFYATSVACSEIGSKISLSLYEFSKCIFDWFAYQHNEIFCPLLILYELLT